MANESVGSAYKGVAATVPGVIEAEEFDEGGEGVGYSDTTSGNKGKVSYGGLFNGSAIQKILDRSVSEQLQMLFEVARACVHNLKGQACMSTPRSMSGTNNSILEHTFDHAL